MRILKKLVIVLGILVTGVIGGGLLGFALGYGLTGKEYSNPHGGLIIVAMLMFGGALCGLIVGAPIAYRLVRDDPKHSSILIHRANICQQKGEYDRAVILYDEAIRLAPNNDLAYHNRGRAKLKKGDEAGANADFERAKQIRQ